MKLPKTLRTTRLMLRRWRASDLEPFAAMNADPEVMEFFPRTLSVQQTKDMIERIDKKFDVDSFGFWAVEVKATSHFVGFVGLNRPAFQAHFTPCVEIGWQIARSEW